MHRQPQQGRGWDPIVYVLLFPYGTDGFHVDISRTARQSRAVDKVGHRYGLLLLLATDAAQRPRLNVVLCGDRLFQQYVVDACAKMEQQRLNYLRLNQNNFRT